MRKPNFRKAVRNNKYSGRMFAQAYPRPAGHKTYWYFNNCSICEAVTWIQDSTKRCEYCINNPDNKPPLPCFELGTQVRFIASTGLIMEGDMAEVVGSQYVSNNCWSGWIYKLTNKTIYQSIFVSDFLLEIAQRGN